MPIPCSEAEVRPPVQPIVCCEMSLNSRPEAFLHCSPTRLPVQPIPPPAQLQDPQTRLLQQKGKASIARAFAVGVHNDSSLTSFEDFLQQKLQDLHIAILCELRGDQSLRCEGQQHECRRAYTEEKKECVLSSGESLCRSRLDAGAQTDAQHIQELLEEPVAPVHSSERSDVRKLKSSNAQQSGSAQGEKWTSQRVSLRSSRQSAEEQAAQSFHTLVTWQRLWEAVMTAVIVVHCAAMAIETQIRGNEIGRALRSDDDLRDDEIALVMFQYVEYVFAGLYTIDIVAKVFVEGRAWVTKGWNWFDVFTVLATVAGMSISSNAPFNPGMLKVLRLARFHRIVRLVKHSHYFEACVLLIRSLQKSLGALMWSATIIFTFILLSGLVASQAMAGYLENEHVPVDKRLEVFRRFGTYSRAVLTMFEVTLGNWGPPAWTLVNNVHEILMLFILFYKITAGFAVVNVINAVFLRQTMKCSEEIDEFTIQQKKKAQESYVQRLGELFQEMDTSGDGVVTFEEFHALIERPSISAWLDLLEISKKDSQELFNSLDGGDGMITVDEWMKGISRIKGDATAVDAMTLMAAISRVEAGITRLKVELLPK